MLKKLFYVHEKRLSMNMVDLLCSFLLSYLLYLNGLRTSLNFGVVVLVSGIFAAKGVFALYRIMKYNRRTEEVDT